MGTVLALKAAGLEYAQVAKMLTQRRRATKPLVAIWGNCQAKALHQVLRASSEFREQYDAIALPPVHEVSTRQLSTIRSILQIATVLLVQPVKDNYRGLPIGAEQIISAAPKARVLKFPSMYYQGLHPFLVYVHAIGELGTPAPLTEGYHDLRFIAAASSSGLTANYADSSALAEAALQSRVELANRERELDIQISDAIPSFGADAFWTVNHPSNEILTLAANQIERYLDVPIQSRTSLRTQLLGDIVAPVHRDVREALKLPINKTPAVWKINGKEFEDERVKEAHLRYYRDRPDVLAAALSEHGHKMKRLGLLEF